MQARERLVDRSPRESCPTAHFALPEYQVSARLRRRGAMPVRHVGSSEHALAWPELPERLPLFLKERVPFLDQNQLALFVVVPIRPRSRLETHAYHSKVSGVEPRCRSSEPRTLPRRGRGLLGARLLCMTDPQDKHHKDQHEPQKYADDLADLSALSRNHFRIPESRRRGENGQYK